MNPHLLDIRTLGSQKYSRKKLEEGYALSNESVRMRKLGLTWTEEYAKEFIKKFRAERRKKEKPEEKA